MAITDSPIDLIRNSVFQISGRRSTGRIKWQTLSVIKPRETASEEHAGQRHEAGEDHGRVQNTAAISANSDGCPSHKTNLQPPGTSRALVSKVSNRSSSLFHDNADDQLDTPSCLVSSNTSSVDVEALFRLCSVPGSRCNRSCAGHSHPAR
jgi:hypothetical protein